MSSMEKPFRITFPIAKTEEMPDGRLYVSGIATSDAIDKQNERLLFDGSVKALSEWMQTGPAVREQHDPLKAVGSGLEMEPITEEGAIRVGVFVSAAEKGTQTKVRENVLRAFSIGGKPLDWKMVKHGDRKVREISAWQMEELSLVDRPANPYCVIDFVKNARLVSGAGEETDMTTKAEDPEKKPATKPPESESETPPEGEGEGETPPPAPPKEGEGEPPPPKDGEPPKEGEGEGEGAPPQEPPKESATVKIDDEQMGMIVAQVADKVLAAMKEQTEAMKAVTSALLRKGSATAAWDIRLALDTLDMLEALKSYEQGEAMNGEKEPADQMPKLIAACTALREFIASEAQELLDAPAAVLASTRNITLVKSAKGELDISSLVATVETLTKAIGDLKADNGEAEAMREGLKSIETVRKGVEQILKMPVPGRAPARFFGPDNGVDITRSAPDQREAVLEELMAKADVVTRPLIERELNFMRAGRVPK